MKPSTEARKQSSPRRKSTHKHSANPISRRLHDHPFPLPGVARKTVSGVWLSEIQELEDRFAEGEMTWAEYCQTLAEVAGR